MSEALNRKTPKRASVTKIAKREVIASPENSADTDDEVLDPARLAARAELKKLLTSIRSLGPKKVEAIMEAGFESIEDLAWHFPMRYLDVRQLVPISKLREHLMQPISVRGKVLSSQFIPGRRKSFAKIALIDESGGILQLVFFDFPQSRSSFFKVDQEYLVAGFVGVYNGITQIVQPPLVEALSDAEPFAQGQMLPIYSIPQAVRKVGIADKLFREVVRAAVIYAISRDKFPEILPESLIDRDRLVPRSDAIRELHIPQSPEQLEAARHRMKYEEVFFLQLRLAIERKRMRKAMKGVITFDVSPLTQALDSDTEASGLAVEILNKLPFTLTNAQKISLREILADMAKTNGRSYPMNRLLQGDVGSGKTIVAVLAMLVAIENGYQCALMVPTEVLAEQHFNTITSLLAGSVVQTALLVGGQPKRFRESVLAAIATGETHIVIGTQALIEKGVRFDRLGLVITDEQHRFGVAQRKALIDKSLDLSQAEDFDSDMFRAASVSAIKRPVTPDVLIMTATPIPRTLALTFYGDIDVSTIRELPRNRKPIKTMLFYEMDHPKIYRAAKERILKKEEQVFIVYPLREKSEKVDSEAAEKAYEYLKANDFKDFRLGLIHGKMTPTEKQEVMRRFRAREFDILVATTVIEVGIDVPNATVMIIEHAERFGLAQLHQLRGRVGRGSAESACVLVASEKLMKSSGNETSDQIEQTSIAHQRLKTLVETSDGFELAKADMMLRGTGEVLGLKQSGKVTLRLANLTTDIEIVQQTLHDAETIVESDPQLRESGNRSTRAEFLRLYRDAESYLHVG